MTLELNKVAPQIDDMGRVLAERAGRVRRAVPAARSLLDLFAADGERLRAVAESDAGQRLRCASPLDERLDLARPAPAMPEQMTLIAADGSQIYPDRHGLAFYFAINVGSIVFRHGSGAPPAQATRPQLYYADEQVYPGGEPVSGDLVGARRGLAEMRALGELAQAEPTDGPPRLALTDGPLLLWLQRAQVPSKEQDQILADYLDALDRLRGAVTPAAGLVSRPFSAEVVALLYLAQLEPEQSGDVAGLHDTPFRGLTDRALFGLLEPGERSALFVRGTAANREFRARGHQICFFYLHTGTEVARVEVPEWVAARPEMLDRVHAAVYDQGRLNNGYPYILTRADELAVIAGEEREVLETMIVQAMARHGLPALGSPGDWPEASRKAQQKKVARWRR